MRFLSSFFIAVLFLLCSPSYSRRVISVGLFSLCENSTNRTPFNEMASYYKDLYTKLPGLALKRLIELSNKTDFMTGVDFVSFDVCNNSNTLLEHLLTILLQNEFFHEGLKQDRVFLLHAFVPPFMSKLIKEVASFEDFVKLCAPVSCDQRFLLQFSEDYSQYLLLLLQRLKWNNLTLVLISQNDLRFPWRHYFEKSYSLLKRTKQFCLKKKVIDVPYKNFTQHMFFKVFPVLQDIVTNGSAIIFFHSRIVHPHIIWQMKRIPFVTKLIMHDFTTSTETEQTNWLAINNVQRSRLDTHLRLVSSDFSMDDTPGEQSVLEYALSSAMYTRLLLSKSALDDVVESSYSLLHGGGSQSSILVPMSDYIYRKQDLKSWLFEPEIASERFFNSVTFEPVVCPTLLCWPGFQQEYSIINRSLLFDEQMGMKCVQCPVNHINPNREHICQPCKGLRNFDNGNRTVCIDPFKDQYFNFDTRSFWIVAATSIFGGVACLIFLVIFLVNRSTPIVKVSDYHVSILHLFTLFATITLSCFLYTFTPTNTTRGMTFLKICVSRNLLLTVCYASNVAFVFIKSQKLLNAFLSTLRLTSGEMKRTMAVQIFAVLLFLLIFNALLLVLYMRNGTPQVIQKLDHLNKIRINLCSTTRHRNLIMWNMNIYQLACLLQAFRGRNLPGPMNNAMSLVYATMTTTISFAVCTVLSLFQRGVVMNFIECMFIILNCATSAFFLYAKQCFTVLFKPHKNTRQYFSHKRMIEMRLQAGLAD